MLLATFGKSLSVKLGADCRRVRSSTMRLPCMLLSSVLQGTAVILPLNATIAWVARPLLSRTTSRTVPRVSPAELSTLEPISLDARCCASEEPAALAVRLEVVDAPDELYVSLPLDDDELSG